MAQLPLVLTDWQYAALTGLILLVFALPFLLRLVEKNLEAFLFVAGLSAIVISGTWNAGSFLHLITEPLPITTMVLVFGLAFHYGRTRFDRILASLTRQLPLPLFLFSTVILLALLSSIITAIIAALLLVEIATHLKLSRTHEIRFVVFACFAIGLGAALTPVGEPLSTIVIGLLHVDFFYLFRLLGMYVIPLIVAIALAASFTGKQGKIHVLTDTEPERSDWAPWIRAGKVYVFVMALLMLGIGLVPLATRFITPLPAGGLYWANIVSAVLDNATLAAVEVTPTLATNQLLAILLGLLISGGMLIPGNIPNIIAADHLKIKSREWARVGVPTGLLLMTVVFFVWLAATNLG